MVHLENSRYTPHDASMILSESRKLTNDMERVIRDVRVARLHIELDVSVDCAIIDELVNRLDSIGKRLRSRNIIESKSQKDDGIHNGVTYFNSERFWESHEAFEGVWLGCAHQSIERDMVQGIILAAAALVHYQKDENDIAISIFNRAAQKLSLAPSQYYGLDINAIRKNIDSMIVSCTPKPFTI